MNVEGPGPRRSTHSAMPVAYGAIGASAAPDLLRFPPADSTPYEEAVQLGSGSERFLTAANLLMTWGAQRVAGVDVIDVETGAPGEYSGVVFTEEGTPELGAAAEDLFTPEGEPYLLPGSTASFVIAKKPARRIMVISTVVETTRLGFSWGDRDEVPGYGEQQIVVEHRTDGTVWAVARGFAFLSATGLLAARKQKALLREVAELAQSFLAALEPGAAIRTGVQKLESDGAASSSDESAVATDASAIGETAETVEQSGFSATESTEPDADAPSER